MTTKNKTAARCLKNIMKYMITYTAKYNLPHNIRSDENILGLQCELSFI